MFIVQHWKIDVTEKHHFKDKYTFNKRNMMKKIELEKLKDTTDIASIICISVLDMLSILVFITLFTFSINKWTNFYPNGFWKFFSTAAFVFAIILCITLVLSFCIFIICRIMLSINNMTL